MAKDQSVWQTSGFSICICQPCWTAILKSNWYNIFSLAKNNYCCLGQTLFIALGLQIEFLSPARLFFSISKYSSFLFIGAMHQGE